MRSVLSRARFSVLAIALALLSFSSLTARNISSFSDFRVDREIGSVRVSVHTSSSRLPAHRLGLRKSSEPVKPLVVVPAIQAVPVAVHSEHARPPDCVIIQDTSFVQRSPRAPPATSIAYIARS